MEKSSAGYGAVLEDCVVDKASKHGVATQRELNVNIAYGLRSTYKCFVQLLQPLLEENHISIGMWYYLRVMWEEDGLTQAQLSERVGLVAPTTVEQLKNMEARGLIERRRSSDDRRKIHVFLSAEGKMLKDKLLPFVAYTNAVAQEGLSPGEVGFLRLVLQRMKDNLTRKIEEASPTSRTGAEIEV
jgi:DNA-binding MarR family transcriptional regulator